MLRSETIVSSSSNGKKILAWVLALDAIQYVSFFISFGGFPNYSLGHIRAVINLFSQTNILILVTPTGCLVDRFFLRAGTAWKQPVDSARLLQPSSFAVCLSFLTYFSCRNGSWKARWKIVEFVEILRLNITISSSMFQGTGLQFSSC